MQALGIAANIFGVITPAKDVGDIVKAIADSIDNVKHNTYRISSLIRILKEHVYALHEARERYEVEGGTIRQIESLRRLQTSLFMVWKKLAELKQSQSNSGLFGLSIRQWWNAGEIKAKIEQLEMDINKCRDLFIFDSLNSFRQEVNNRFNSIDDLMKRSITQNNDSGGLRFEVQYTTMWKIPMKADDSNPMATNYRYLRIKFLSLSNAVKDNISLIEQLLWNDAKNFKNKQSKGFRSPIGNPTSECEDASHLAIKLTREIQNRNSSISIIDWFDGLTELGSTLNRVGLKKEAIRIRQFELRILTLLASEKGSNVDSRLAGCLHNLAVSYHDKGRYDEAISFAERAVDIRRRLGDPFIPLLADSLFILASCFRRSSRIEKAEKFNQESTDLIRELASNDPLQFGLQMAKYLRGEAYLHFDLEKYQKAIDYSGEAVKWLYKSSPRFKVEFPYDYCKAQWLTALAYRELGNLEKVIEFGREAAIIFNRLICERPQYYINNGRKGSLSAWLCLIGRIQDAIHVLEEKLAVYCSVEPSSAVQTEFATILYERAEYLYCEDRLPDALNAVSQVIDVRRHLLEEESNDYSLKQLLNAFNLHCSCLISLRRPSDAMKTIETMFNLLWPSLIAVWGSAQSDILKDLVRKKSTIKKLQSNKDASNLEKYKVLSTIDNAILFWRQRECSSSDLFNQTRLRFDILIGMQESDIAFLTIKETINWYRCKLNSNIAKECLSSLIQLLSFSAEFFEQWDFVDDFLIFLKNAFKYVKWDNDYFFYNITDLKIYLISNLIQQNKQLMVLEALNMFEGVVRPRTDGQTCYSNHCLAGILTTRSQCYFDFGRFVEALQDAKEAVEIHRYAVSKCEEVYDRLYNECLGKDLHAHARVLFALKDFDGALKSVDESIQLDKKFKFDDFDDTRRNLIELRAEIFNRLKSSADVKDVV